MSQGVLATFATETQWAEARARLLEVGINVTETYTPVPPADADEGSALPGWIAAAGLAGALAAFGLQYYADAVSYPLDIGGRPDFSWPAFIPIAFEIGALCAILTGFFGFFIVNHLPRLFDPVDACAGMRDVLRTDWVLAVRDAARLAEARRILTDCRPKSLEVIPT